MGIFDGDEKHERESRNRLVIPRVCISLSSAPITRGIIRRGRRWLDEMEGSCPKLLCLIRLTNAQLHTLEGDKYTYSYTGNTRTICPPFFPTTKRNHKRFHMCVGSLWTY